MKTTFSRLFSMIAALLMLCLLITGVAFRFLMMSWVESEKRKSLSADASALADLAEAYDSAGELESNWNFQIGLSLFSEVGEVSAMICDEDGILWLPGAAVRDGAQIDSAAARADNGSDEVSRVDLIYIAPIDS